MSYKTTLENLTRDTLVHIDLQYTKQSNSSKNQKLSSTTGIDQDNIKNRWINGSVLEVRQNTVLVQLDHSSKLRDEDEEAEMMNSSEFSSGGAMGSSMMMMGGTDGSFSVEPETNETELECPVEQVFLKNPDSIQAADDITTLSYLHEPALLTNLYLRYKKKAIYTFCGNILIAINPYQRLSKDMYSNEAIEIYKGVAMGKLNPHVYAIAEDCYSSMMREGKNQSILVSGESGAGKTENCKFILQYFAAMGKQSKSETKKTAIENQVLQSTPLLEAFGNAKTLRNDNSSRFGKFIEIQFNSIGVISGAFLYTYLLEKSRVTKQTVGERNYHIFYQLIDSCTDEEKEELLQGKRIHDFTYLNQSETYYIDGVSDAETYEATKQAMSSVNIYDADQRAIRRVLAAILHMGNVSFAEIDADSCSIVDYEPLNKACELLNLNPTLIANTFLTRKVVAGRDSYTTPLKVEQAESCRDALSMLLYSRMFDWIVKRMNESINNPSQAKYTIGVLDIYGFESFENNSFEQFCINYANEKLQQQYNQHIFKLSQQEYVREKINWSMLQFNDNQACLDLIENSPMSILKILDEECSFPKSNEQTFAEKLYKNHTNNQYFSKPRFSNTAFTINHYADAVTYDTTHFLNKNKDYIVPEQLEALKSCPDAFVKGLFMEPPKPSSAAASKSQSSFKFISVASQFKDSLAMLMDKISKTYPHYIRCIKPNSQKKPGLFNFELILSQLKCGGILESIRICLEGYPTKKTYNEFLERYRIVAPDISGADIKESCEKLLSTMAIDKDQYQLGISKIFLRSGQIEKMEMNRSSKLSNSAITIQKNVRRMIQRRKWKAIRSSSTHIGSCARTAIIEEEYEALRQNFASKNIGQVTRTTLERRIVLDQFDQIVCLQNTIARKLNSNALQQKKLTLRLALSVQSAFRGLVKRHNYEVSLAEAKSIEAMKKQKEELEVKFRELVAQRENEATQKTQLEEKAVELEKEKEQLESKIIDTTQSWERKFSDLENILVETKLKLESVEQDNASLQEKLSTSEKHISEESAHAQSLTTKIESLEEQLKQKTEDLERETSALSTEIESLKSSVAEGENTANSLNESLNALTVELNELKKTLELTEEQKRKADESNQELRQTIEEKISEIVQLNKKCGDIEEDNNDLHKELDQKDNRIRELELQVEQLTKKCEELSNQLDDLRKAISENTSASDIQAQDFNKQLESKLAQIEELTAALDEKKKKLKKEQERRTQEENEFAVQFENITQQHMEELNERVAKEKELKKDIKKKEEQIQQYINQLEQTKTELSTENNRRIALEQDKQLLEQEKQRLIQEKQIGALEFENLLAQANIKYSSLQSNYDSIVCDLERESNEKKRVEEEKFALVSSMNSSSSEWLTKYESIHNNYVSLQSHLEEVKNEKEALRESLEKQTAALLIETEEKLKVEEAVSMLEKEREESIQEREKREEEFRNQLSEKESEYAQLQQTLDKVQSHLLEEKEQKKNEQEKLARVELALANERKKMEEDRAKFLEENNKALQEYKKMMEDLTKQKQLVTSLNKQLQEKDLEKTRVLKRNEAAMGWEIDKCLSAFPGNRQERAERLIVFLMYEIDKEFCNGVIPTPAFIFYHMIKCWRSDLEGCERVLQLIENLLKATITSCEASALPYWFSNISCLLQLCSTEDFLSSIEQLENLAETNSEYTVPSIRANIKGTLDTGSYMTFSEELDAIIANHDNREFSDNIFVKFIQQLTHLFMNSYAQLVNNCCNSIIGLLKSNIIDQTLFDEKSPESPKIIEASAVVVGHVKDFLHTLRCNNIAESIIVKSMNQIFMFIDITLFNEILFRNGICSSAIGSQLKVRIDHLEADISSTTGVEAKLKLVRQAIHVLICDKKSLLVEQTRMKLTPNLNSAQILKILRAYQKSDFESNIPNEVYSFFSHNSPALVPLFPESSTLLDAKEIVPFGSLDEIENKELALEMPYMSFPIPIKEQLNKMRDEQIKKEQEQLALTAAAIKFSQALPSSGAYVMGSTTPRGTNPLTIPTPRGNSTSPSITPTEPKEEKRRLSFWGRK